MRIAVYPGSFDPITNGHLEIIKRALKIFDKVIVLVANNPEKHMFFSIEERLEMISAAVVDLKHVEVDASAGLSVTYAREHGAVALVRGLRAVSDFEYEFSLAAGNEYIDSSVEMIFFMSRSGSTFISSSMIKDLYDNGVDILPLVPPSVLKLFEKRKGIK
ncbi:MAG: pantetheine-phosphate adenylyltransferase [Firmicutes bacterium]|nr:pantetheine-phosphate adenylyltransferase [Bacillota bacterium]